MNWLQKLVGAKSEEEIEATVREEPTIKEARRALDRVDRILEELEAIEARPIKAKPVKRGQLSV